MKMNSKETFSKMTVVKFMASHLMFLFVSDHSVKGIICSEFGRIGIEVTYKDYFFHHEHIQVFRKRVHLGLYCCPFRIV